MAAPLGSSCRHSQALLTAKARHRPLDTKSPIQVRGLKAHGRPVFLLTGSQRRASAGASEGLPWRHSRRWLRCPAGSMICSSAIGLSRPPAGRTCGANSLMSTPPPARPSPKKRSIALVNSTSSRRPSTDHRPSDDNSSASCSQSRLPRPWPRGPRRPCAGSPASPNLPKPSAISGRAGPRWCVASTTAGWRSTTIPPSAPCAVSRCSVHCAPLVQVFGNIGSWFADTMRHGRPVRPIAAATRSCCRSSTRI